ncbi:linear amide C-N hydrolase [Planctomicrobium sp. SH668]|uniref:linear amide C-N hydrolase n=1 Tax=Planctomicrobium sp. SH668 TaxID=3448126 RepID=UPI003F5C1753
MLNLSLRSIFALSSASAVALATLSSPVAEACTRAVYFGKERQTVTGRTMDWAEEMQTNLWTFPRGMNRNGGLEKGSLEWTSKYGSVVASIYEGGTADGMNEKGLVANMLYLVESEYPAETDTRPAVVITAWAQYLLDNFATVEEAVKEVEQDKIRIVPVVAPNGSKGAVHLAISDPTGDSAIFEYVNGELIIHHGRQYQVMTNSPTYDQQLALNKYWESIGGTVMLPGTSRAADRFARASFFINACRQSADPREAVASVFSVMRSVSVPRGISVEGQPNISSTLWRTVSDQKNLVYFYEGTFSPSVLWVDLKQIDFSPEAGVRKLTLDGYPDTAGNQSKNFKPAAAFKFLAPE